MNNVLVIGSINMDMVINTPRMPVFGQTVTGGEFSNIPGGKGQNQAIAASRLGCQVKIIGAVGKDIYGEELKKTLSANGVDTAGIQTVDTSSGIAVITVFNGENCIILDGGANEKIDENTINQSIALIDWADVVVIQFEIPFNALMYASKQAKQHKKTVILNPAPMLEFDKEILKYIDVFVPNQHEAGQLLGMKIDSAEAGKKAAEKLLDFGIKQVIITLGADGCVYNDGGLIKHQKSFDITVVDTTAAGDSFIGGICKGMCCGYKTEHTIMYATAVSTLAVSKKGATTSLPYETEVDDLLAGLGIELYSAQ